MRPPFARVTNNVISWGLRGWGRANGFNAADFQRVEEHLRTDMGLRSPRYRHALQKPKHYFPGLTGIPWHDPADHAVAAALKGAHAAIKRELADVRSLLLPQPQGLTGRGTWEIFYFYHRGKRVAANCDRCPETARVIDSIPRLTNTGLVYFSVLTPGTHITPHCGPIDTRLRCHLGVDVPKGCHIRVGSETRSWEEGRCLVFDDSFEHEVWHSGDAVRTVLVLDVWHDAGRRAPAPHRANRRDRAGRQWQSQGRDLVLPRMTRDSTAAYLGGGRPARAGATLPDDVPGLRGGRSARDAGRRRLMMAEPGDAGLPRRNAVAEWITAVALAAMLALPGPAEAGEQLWAPLGNLFGRPGQSVDQVRQMRALVGERRSGPSLVMVSHGSTIHA
jgi:aspartate beta-hydroxylase